MSDTENEPDDGPLDTSRGHADPAGFPDGDEIDSAAVEEDADGFAEPADPDAEPDDDADAAAGGDPQ